MKTTKLADIPLFTLLLGLLFLGIAGLARAEAGEQPTALTLSREESAWLAAHPVIRLGIDASYGPYSYLDEQGQFQGVVREYLSHIERSLNIRFEIISNLDWPQLMEAVREKRLDAVATVAHLKEREAFLEFSSLYLRTPLVIMTRENAPQLRSLKELPSLNLALVNGYASSKQVMALYPAIHPIFVTTPIDGLRAVASGMVDAYVGVLGVNTFLARQHGLSNLKVNAAFDMSVDGQRFGVRKDWPQLVRLLDKALAAIPAATRENILQRWIPIQAKNIARLSTPTLAARLFPWLLGFTGLVLLGYLTLWFLNHMLKRELGRRQAILERAQTIAHLGDWSMEIATGRILWSDELFRIAGRAPRTLDWPTLREWIHPDDRDGHEDYLSRLGKLSPGEQLPPLHSRLMRPDGAYRWLEITCLTDFDAQNKPHHHYGTALDITARRQTEAALLESETRLRLFIDHAPAALAMFDREMRYLAVSRRWLSDYRLEPGDLLGRCHYEVLPEVPEDWKAVHRRGLAGEVVRADEDRFERADGSVQWLRWEVRPWHTADGEVGGIVIFSEDISEHKAAEQALRESEARFVATFEQAAMGIALVSPEGQWLRVNHKLCEIVGYDAAELMARTFQDITHPDDLDADLGQVRRMLAREIDSYAMEKRYLRKGGAIVWINLTAALVWKPEGVPDYFIAVIEDIDSRKAAELALHESEARYRSLLEMAPFPAVLTRVRDGILLYGNHRAEIQYGIKREAGIGQAADRFYEDPAERAKFVEALQQRGQVNDLELRMRGMDGRHFWALVSASVVDFDNEPTIFAAINDISARKQAQAALQEQEEFFRLIAENMGDMVAVLDTEGRRLYNSPSYRDLFGAPEALKGTDSFAEIHPDDQERVRAIFAETVRTGLGHRLDFRFVVADGGVRDIESQGGVIKNAAGAVERVVVVSRDITERKRLENEIHQLNAELEERVRQRTAELATANKELETFTYSVSHDLKAPLRGIDGYSRLLLEDHQAQLDEEGQLFLGNVRHGVEQMSQLIEDLLAYSRMERRSLSDRTLDLPALVTSILEERRADIEARGIQVEVALEGLSVRADPDGLAMVLRNLIDNALKFSRDSAPPTLRIRGEARPNTTILEIKDNGIGFDMQFHDRIFDIFQRLQRAEDYPGTGVGLAIVRKAMQRMGGQIRAESAPGAGATFHLELPR